MAQTQFFTQNLFIVYRKFKFRLESCLSMWEVWPVSRGAILMFSVETFSLLRVTCSTVWRRPNRKVNPSPFVVPNPHRANPVVASGCCIFARFTWVQSHAHTHMLTRSRCFRRTHTHAPHAHLLPHSHTNPLLAPARFHTHRLPVVSSHLQLCGFPGDGQSDLTSALSQFDFGEGFLAIALKF